MKWFVVGIGGLYPFSSRAEAARVAETLKEIEGTKWEAVCFHDDWFVVCGGFLQRAVDRDAAEVKAAILGESDGIGWAAVFQP